MKAVKRFLGFAAGEVRVTPLPNVFFTEVLPHIDSLAEAKTTLHLWWLLHSRGRRPKCVTRKELLGDELLLRGLEGGGLPPAELIKEGLEAALARGTFLGVRQEGDGDDLLFANDEEGRRSAERVRSGEVALEEPASPSPVGGERPNIFVLYEQNVGLLQPLIVEELREAEESYPSSWIKDAFKIAAERNVRNWRYIRSILERWKSEGKDDERGQRSMEAGRRRDVDGKFSEYIQH